MTGPAAPARVLLLGGTAEARALATELVARGVPVISSLAGRVARPRLPAGEVRIGGFGGTDGLRTWLRDNNIAAVVDATHPYATTITAHAVAATDAVGVPMVRLCRPPWVPQADECWRTVPTLADAARYVASGPGRVFLTTGRQDVDAFAGIDAAWFLIRVVDAPMSGLPPHHELLTARGPYDFDNELALLRDHRIDTLVTKNSGGPLTRPKLDAARAAGVDVVMIDRPQMLVSGPVVPDVDTALRWLVDHGHAG